MWRNKKRSDTIQNLIGGGYTIVEAMIFLAVSGALVVSALTVIGAQQDRTEFSQAIRELESRMLDTINDVSTGFYPTTEGIKCDALLPIGSGITLSGASVEQGQNSGCIFIGRVIQFAPAGTDGQSMRVYTAAGQRLRATPAGPREIRSLEEAKGQLIARGQSTGTSAPDVYDDVDLGPLKIGKVCYNGCTSAQETGGVGFFTTFSTYTGNALDSGATSADLVAIPNSASTTINQAPGEFVDRLNTVLSSPAINSVKNPSGGFTICVLSQSTPQYALLRIGGQARSLSTELIVRSGSTCP